MAPLTHPLVIACLVGWLLNDAVLKDLFGNAVTGKLSDGLAMVVFPTLIAVALSPFSRHPMRWGIGATAALFTSINLFAVADHAAESALGLAITSELTPDPSDLAVLPLLLVAHHLWRHAPERPAGTSRRILGRAVFGAGIIACAATSPAEEPSTNDVSTTFVLTAENPQHDISVTWHQRYQSDDEAQKPNLIADVTYTAYGAGPGDSSASPTELVGRTDSGSDLSWTLQDPSWSPVEVTLTAYASGDDGVVCLASDDTCDQATAVAVIDAGPTETAAEPDTILELPGGELEEWVAVEAVIRFDPSDPPRILFSSQYDPRFATAEATIDVTTQRLQTIPPLEDCPQLCEMSLWTSYRTVPEVKSYGLYGQVEVVEVRRHTLVETDAPVVTYDTAGPLYKRETETWEFCITADTEIVTPIDEITTFTDLGTSYGKGDDQPEAPRMQPTRLLPSSDSCFAVGRVTSDGYGARSQGFGRISVSAAVWTLAENRPQEVSFTRTVS